MWGCSNAQIFSEVSPRCTGSSPWSTISAGSSRWGLTYYGCCEPLDGKIDLLRRIPNLRKISVSPWCKTERAVETIGPHYVMSRKPNPAIFAEDDWHPERARQDLRDFLDTGPGLPRGADHEGHLHGAASRNGSGSGRGSPWRK